MHIRLAATVLAAFLLATACGSTNRPSSQRARGTAAPEASADAGEVIESLVPGETPSATTGGTKRPTASTGKGTTAGGSGGTTGGAATGGTGGAPSGKLVIGAHFSNNANAAAQFGANRLPSEGRRETEALVKWINEKAGGIHGRPIELVTHTTDPLQGTFDAQTQAACEDLKDKGAQIAVSDALTPSTVLAQCFANAKIPFVWTYEILLTRTFVADTAGYLYQPQTFHSARLGVIIDGLVAQGFLTKQNRIGIVRYDTDTHKEYLEEVFRPRLAAHGLSVEAEGAFLQPRSASDAGAVTAQASNTIINFQTKQIDRVVFIPTGAAMPLLFMAAAESQNFHPGYGLSSLDPPVFLAANFKGTQLRGSRAVGWLPPGDVEPAQDPGGVAGYKRCDEAVRSGGFTAAEARLVTAYCESIFLIKDALDRTTDHSGTGLRKAIEGLGTSWQDPRTFRSRWTSGRYDAAAAYGAVGYDETCSCFKYLNTALTDVP